MEKALFIINPKSGQGTIREELLEVFETLCSRFKITVHITTSQGDAENIAFEQSEYYDRIICAGGDGTLNEVVNGLARAKKRPQIGYIPCGTSNDFASSLKISKYPEEAAKLAISDDIFKVDIGKFNDRHFIYIAAFGAFTQVSYTTKQPTKNIFGHAAYVLAGIRSLPSIKSYKIKVECDEFNETGSFVYGMVSNATSVGGIVDVKDQNVELDDGLFEVILIRQPENAGQIQGLITMLLAHDMSSPLISNFKTRKIKFTSEQQIPWTLDGEYGGTQNDVSIDNIEKSLVIICKDMK